MIIQYTARAGFAPRPLGIPARTPGPRNLQAGTPRSDETTSLRTAKICIDMANQIQGTKTMLPAIMKMATNCKSKNTVFKKMHLFISQFNHSPPSFAMAKRQGYSPCLPSSDGWKSFLGTSACEASECDCRIDICVHKNSALSGAMCKDVSGKQQEKMETYVVCCSCLAFSNGDAQHPKRWLWQGQKAFFAHELRRYNIVK